jgi:hypothetical protein
LGAYYLRGFFLIIWLVLLVSADHLKKRTEYLFDNKIISQSLHDGLNWVWDMRNNMYLFLLDGREYENFYNAPSHVGCANTFKEFIKVLDSKGRIK